MKREELRFVCEQFRQHGYEAAQRTFEHRAQEQAWRKALNDANIKIRELEGVTGYDTPLEER